MASKRPRLFPSADWLTQACPMANSAVVARPVVNLTPRRTGTNSVKAKINFDAMQIAAPAANDRMWPICVIQPDVRKQPTWKPSE